MKKKKKTFEKKKPLKKRKNLWKKTFEKKKLFFFLRDFFQKNKPLKKTFEKKKKTFEKKKKPLKKRKNLWKKRKNLWKKKKKKKKTFEKKKKKKKKTFEKKKKNLWKKKLKKKKKNLRKKKPCHFGSRQAVSSKHHCHKSRSVVKFYMAHQNFEDVSSVTPQDDEAVCGEMDVQGTCLVDKHELMVALREMGKTECEIQRLLDTVSVKHKMPDAWREMGITEREFQQLLVELNLEQREEMITPSPQPYSHKIDVPLVGSRVTESKSRETHDVPVLGAVTMGAHTFYIVREKVDSADEESLAHTFGGSGTEEMESVPLPRNLSSTTFRRPCVRTRVPLCWHGAQCPWHRRGRCPLQAREAVRSPVTGENEIKAELNALWTALKKLAASLMWRTANAAATSAAITAACTERLPERTTEQIEVIPLLQAPASQVTGSLIRLDESDAVVYPQVCQEQYAAGETNRNRVDAPTVQEPLLGQGIPELQVVEQKQERTVEAIKVNPLERVQRRAVEQSVSLFERLEEFDKRLEMSLARRAENDEMIKEIGILLEEEKTCNAETGFSRFWAGGMGSGGYWISPIWVGSRGRVRIAPPRFRCTHMFDVSSNPSDGSCTFQMVGWSDVYVIATSVNLNNGELVEWSSIGTVTCQQCDEWGAFIDLQLWSIAWNDHLSVSISVLRISSSFVHCCFFCAPWIFICLS